MPFSTCPQCDNRIRFSEMPDVGDIVLCRTCDTRLEVVSLNPIVLDWPFDLADADDDVDDDDEFAIYPDEEEELEEDDLDEY